MIYLYRAVHLDIYFTITLQQAIASADTGKNLKFFDVSVM